MLVMGGVFTAAVAEPIGVVEFKPVANVAAEEITVAPSTLVKTPEQYLNKKVIINARFDKFTTVGLDYPPALRKSEDYITFMLYRDNTSFDIPQSELKLFLKRDAAQKFVDLKSKDKVTVTGKVFSTALGDVWVDVEKLETIK